MMSPLPPELIDDIFSHLYPSPSIDYTEGIPYEEFPSGKLDLCQCSLVSRLWRALSLLHLFRDVRISYQSAEVVRDSREKEKPTCNDYGERNTRQKILSDFASFVANSPHIARYIRKLRLVFAPRASSSALGGFRWSSTDYPTKDLLLSLLDRILLPNLMDVELRDIFMGQHHVDCHPSSTPDRIVVAVPPLRELRIHSQVHHTLSLPDLSAVLALFGSVDRLQLCGYPAIQSGYDRSRYDGCALQQFRPKCIAVNDPGCYGPLLLKLSASSPSSTESVVVGVGASQKYTPTDGMAQLVQNVGHQLRNLSFVHMLQEISHESWGLSTCLHLETLTFHFNVHDEQWFYPNAQRWHSIAFLLESIASIHQNWPALHKVVFSLPSYTGGRCFQRDQSFIHDVEEAIVHLVTARSSTHMGRCMAGWDTKPRSLPRLSLAIVPQPTPGHRAARFSGVLQQRIRAAFPRLDEIGVLDL